jgi:hypothetical protein
MSANRSSLTARLSAEPLEERALAASGGFEPPTTLPTVNATLAAGVLRVNGTYMSDAINIRQANGVITVSGVAGYFPAGAVTRVEVNGHGGNDVIRLNSEASGGQPILKPTVVNGGAGNDVIFGGYGNDVISGGAGDDTIFGGPGIDRITGDAGADRTYGGAGNDRITADTADLFAYGQAGTDVIAFERVDPAVLAGYNEATMKAALQVGLSGWSFGKTKGGEKITVKNLQVLDVAIVNGTTTVFLKAEIRYQKTRGFPQFSVSGTIKFSVQPQLSASFIEGSLTSASIKMARPEVQDVNLSNVPNWLDSTSEVKNFLEVKIAEQSPIPVTALMQAFLAAGGSLGPTISV